MFQVEVLGEPSGHAGHCTFYKGIKVHSTPADIKNNKLGNTVSPGKVKDQDGTGSEETKENANNKQMKLKDKPLVLALGDCIPVRPWSDSPIECLAEMLLVWRDKNEHCLLVSLRLYFLPENTQQGRHCHGEDEVVAVIEKVIIRAEDFATWIVPDLNWNWGLLANYNEKCVPSEKLVSSNGGLSMNSLLTNTNLDFSDIELEKLSDKNNHSNVTILSYPRYCRYRAILKRLEGIEDNYVRTKLIETLSGYVASQPNTRIMFCKDSIEYPELESHEMLCNHLAPNLKNKNQKTKKRSVSESPQPSEPSVEDYDSCNSDDSRYSGAQRTLKTPIKTSTKSDEPKVTGGLDKRKQAKKEIQYYSEDEEESSEEDDEDSDEDYGKRMTNTSRERKNKEKTSSKIVNSKKTQVANSAGQKPLTPDKNKPVTPAESMSDKEKSELMNRLNKMMSEGSLAYGKLLRMGFENANLYNQMPGFGALPAQSELWKNLVSDQVPDKSRSSPQIPKLEPGFFPSPDLTISLPGNKVQSKVDRSNSPAIEIIPIKKEQKKDYKESKDNGKYYNKNGEDEKRPSNSAENLLEMQYKNIPYLQQFYKKLLDSQLSLFTREPVDQQQKPPKEKENIPVKKSQDVIELDDSDEERNDKNHSQPPMKKQKLDILREGGLEVTPISNGQGGFETSRSMSYKNPQKSNDTNHQKCQTKEIPGTSQATGKPPKIKPPPVQFQSINMFQTTQKIFGNPKDFLPRKNAGPSQAPECLDLTVKPGENGARKRPVEFPVNLTNTTRLPKDLSVSNARIPTYEIPDYSKNMPPNDSLQITLVKKQSKQQPFLAQKQRNSTPNHSKNPYGLDVSKIAGYPMGPTSSSAMPTNSTNPLNLPPNLANQFSNDLFLKAFSNPLLSASLAPNLLSTVPSMGGQSVPSNSMKNSKHDPNQALLNNQDFKNRIAANLGSSSSAAATPSLNPAMSAVPFMDPLYLSALYNNSLYPLGGAIRPADLLKYFKNPDSTPTSKS